MIARSRRPSSTLVLVLLATACQPEAPVTPLPMTQPPPAARLSSDLAAFFHGGGCYPQGVPLGSIDAQFSQIALINPHWAPVQSGQSPDSDPILVHGIVHSPHGNDGGDFPVDHGSSDATAELELDAADRNFAATGNGSDANARLEIEWESGKWPDWAWPGEGDRIVALGRWIYDCGHDGAQAGHCMADGARTCIVDADCQPPACSTCSAMDVCQGQHFQYSSELHPPYATAVLRQGRGGRVASETSVASAATRADIFVSVDGGSAGDRCVVSHHDPLVDLIFSTECYPLAQPLAPLNKYDCRAASRPTPTPCAPYAEVPSLPAARSFPSSIPARSR